MVKHPEYKSNVEQAMKMVIVYIASRSETINLLNKIFLYDFSQAFLDLDDAMLTDESTLEQMAGSTAVVVLIKDNKLFCANAGDSRAIASINGNVEILSMDHKPNNDKEFKRICEAGGWVEYNRVNGNLALSRALGDFIFKKNTGKNAESQIVTGKI